MTKEKPKEDMKKITLPKKSTPEIREYEEAVRRGKPKEDWEEEFDDSFVYEEGKAIFISREGVEQNTIGRLHEKQVNPIKDFIQSQIDKAKKEEIERIKDMIDGKPMKVEFYKKGSKPAL